ncbi:MAG: HD domain-containing phosphohydrolase [Georgfuchsia sp.]
MATTAMRLLLIEDNPGDARLVQAALTEYAPAEFAITTTERLADALVRIRREHYDVVLCDLGLPDSTRLETAQAIIKAAPTLPLVVLTGTYDEDLGRAAIELGAQEYLIKGESGGVLIARSLRYAIERKRMERDLRGANEALEHRVTERTAELQRVNQSLREGELRYRQLFEANPHPMWVFDVETLAFLAVNDAAVARYGWSRQEFLAMTLNDIRPAETIAVLHQKLAADNEKIIRTVNSKHRIKDGTLIDVEISSHKVDFGGRSARIAAAYDITERKVAEEKIRRYIEQLKTAVMSTVEVATTMSEMRDPYTSGHERRVAEIANAIGVELGLDESQQEGLQVAGHLHDVGKITIPSEILSKPGKLSAIEYQMIQGHAQSGYEVLKSVEFPWPVAQVALQHHERMDGSGYPQGLKGKDILLEARIMAVADVVEAMSSHRPYRPGLGIEAALAEIERGRGTSYDPVVTDACLKLFREKGYALSTSEGT